MKSISFRIWTHPSIQKPISFQLTNIIGITQMMYYSCRDREIVTSSCAELLILWDCNRLIMETLCCVFKETKQSVFPNTSNQIAICKRTKSKLVSLHAKITDSIFLNKQSMLQLIQKALVLLVKSKYLLPLSIDAVLQIICYQWHQYFILLFQFNTVLPFQYKASTYISLARQVFKCNP